MPTQDLAKQEVAAWMQATHGIEKHHPGIFQRIEEELIRGKTHQVDYEMAMRVAATFAKDFISPESYLAMHQEAPSTRTQDLVDKTKLAGLAVELCTAANFRLTQQAFSFDRELTNALIEPELFKNDSLTDDEGTPLPTDFLLRMPFPAFVIVPNTATIRSILVSSKTLQFENNSLLTIDLSVRGVAEIGEVPPINIGIDVCPGQTLRQCISDAVNNPRRMFGEQGNVTTSKEVYMRLFEFALPLILYLCADNREVEGDSAPPPSVTKTKRGLRMFPAARPSVARVGVRIGSVLRMHRDGCEPGAAEHEAGTGSRIVPHVRRSHWHTFWTGPRKDILARRKKLHFLPPIPVNMETFEDLQPSVRPTLAG